jgi:hypothetical protein
MGDDTGKAQGLAIDNLSFAATALGTPTNTPVLSVQGAPASPLVLAWPSSSVGFQLYFATNLAPPIVWTLVSTGPAQSNGMNILNVPTTNTTAQFFRLMGR